MPSAARSDALPRSFGPYVLFDFVGKGGMAELFLARQSMGLGATRLCVVKQIAPGLAGDAKFSDMFVHEAKLAARLNHANVVQVFDLGREDERLFIAMEYVEGFDLNDLLRRCSRADVPLPFDLAVDLVRDTLRGLDYAHRRTDDDGRALGLVHRDVSPSNLLLSFDGGVKVCDFGIAHANEAIAVGSSERDLGDALKGKAGYMSPEQARGEAVDARADVFAVGIVLWELASGRRLYRAGEGAPALLEQARRAQIPPLTPKGLPREEDLQAIVSRALAVQRDERYPTAGAMLRDLDAYAARAGLMTNTLRLGQWLATTFGADVISRRRSRERALSALDHGAPLVARPITTPRPAPTGPGAEAGPPAGQSPSDTRRAMPSVALVAMVIVALASALVALAMR